MKGIFVKFKSGSVNLYEQALKDEVKLCKKLASTVFRFAHNKCTYGELDQARADLINHLIFMRELENGETK